MRTPGSQSSRRRPRGSRPTMPPRGWGAVSAGAVAPRLVFVVTQDANPPPRLATLDSRARVTRVVFDPNPGLLERRRFGRADVFHWTSKAGRMFAGGLYYPLDYGSGRRYPLVLQTHGYDSTAFAP